VTEKLEQLLPKPRTAHEKNVSNIKKKDTAGRCQSSRALQKKVPGRGNSVPDVKEGLDEA